MGTQYVQSFCDVRMVITKESVWEDRESRLRRRIIDPAAAKNISWMGYKGSVMLGTTLANDI